MRDRDEGAGREHNIEDLVCHDVESIHFKMRE